MAAQFQALVDGSFEFGVAHDCGLDWEAHCRRRASFLTLQGYTQQAEGRCRCEHVTVTGMNGGKGLLSCAGQMESICGAKEKMGWEHPHAFLSSLKQRFVHWMPLPETVGTIELKLIAQQGKTLSVHCVFAQLAVKYRQDFRFSYEEARNGLMLLGETDYPRAIRLCEIEFGDIARIKVDHRSSRISEIALVLSVPPERLAWSFANSGKTFLERKGFEGFGSAGTGTILATAWPFSVITTSSRAAALRTHKSVCS
jgi:hypothetical protein